MFSEPVIINCGIAITGVLASFVCRIAWKILCDLQEADKTISEKTADIELSLHEDYVKKTDLSQFAREVAANIDRVDSRDVPLRHRSLSY